MGPAGVIHRPLGPVSVIATAAAAARSNRSLLRHHQLPFRFRRLPLRPKQFRSWASKNLRPKPQTSNPATDTESSSTEEKDGEGLDVGWLPTFPHALIASMSNFLFGYHIGVMNGPIVSIAQELGFEGNSFLEGLVVSIFIAGAFIGSISSGSLCDKLGCRRTFQIDTIPLILGTFLSAQAHSVDEVLWGRFLVGLGIGVNTVLVPIYISEVAPTKYRGSLGALPQIGTCLGLMVSLFLAILSENDPHWWRTLLYIATVPAFILAIGMQFTVDSPRWLCKVGRLTEARSIIFNLWGSSKIDKVIKEFQSVIQRDGIDSESRWLELLEEPHRRGCIKLP